MVKGSYEGKLVAPSFSEKTSESNANAAFPKFFHSTLALVAGIIKTRRAHAAKAGKT